MLGVKEGQGILNDDLGLSPGNYLLEVDSVLVSSTVSAGHAKGMVKNYLNAQQS